PERRGIRTEHFNALRSTEIKQIEGGPPVRLGLREAVQVEADTTRGASIGALAGSASTEPANEHPDVVVPRPRLNERPGNERKRFVQAVVPVELKLLAWHHRRGQRHFEVVLCLPRCNDGDCRGVVLK